MKHERALGTEKNDSGELRSADAKAQNNAVQSRSTKLRSICKAKKSSAKNACASRKSGTPKRGYARTLNELKLGARRPLGRDYDFSPEPCDELIKQKMLGFAAVNNNGRR